MNPVKMFSFAAPVALMAMAFIGPSSAMAESTALCKEDVVSVPGEVCPVAQRISHVHEVTVTKATLLSSLNTILCDVLFLGDVTSANNLGNPLEILGHFTYSNCVDHNTRSCTVNEISTHTLFKELKLGHELADITVAFETLAECGPLIHCEYDGTGIVGHNLGPLLAEEENGEEKITEQTLNKTGGFLCPKTTKLDIWTSSLVPTYIAK